MTSGQGARYSRLAMKPLQPMRACSTALATVPGIFVGTTIPAGGRPQRRASRHTPVTCSSHCREAVSFKARQSVKRPLS